METDEEVAQAAAAVQAQLSDIKSAIDANTRATQRSRVWLWTQGLIIAVVIGLGTLTWWDDRQDDQREDKREQEEDRRLGEESRRDCVNGIEIREEGRQRLLEIAREINSQRLTDIINGSYEDIAPPAACD
jgi:hypothetical protein